MRSGSSKSRRALNKDTYPVARLLTPDEIEDISRGTPRQVVNRVNELSTLQCVWALCVIAFKVFAIPAIVASVLVEGFGGTGFLLSWFLGGKRGGDDT